MSIFSRKKPDPALVERLETLEREIRNLRLDWSEAYDKIARMMGRIAKREGALLAREEALSPAAQEPAGDTNTPPSTLDPISQQVLALRRRRGAP
jgi:hypothetical protein